MSTYLSYFYYYLHILPPYLVIETLRSSKINLIPQRSKVLDAGSPFRSWSLPNCHYCLLLTSQIISSQNKSFPTHNETEWENAFLICLITHQICGISNGSVAMNHWKQLYFWWGFSSCLLFLYFSAHTHVITVAGNFECHRLLYLSLLSEKQLENLQDDLIWDSFSEDNVKSN